MGFVVAMRVPPPKDRLTAADVTFLINVLGETGNSEAISSLLRDDESLRQVLDLPAVFKAVIESPAIVGISPALYFYVVVRRVFRDAGLDDVTLTHYVACVLSQKVGVQGPRPGNHSRRSMSSISSNGFRRVTASRVSSGGWRRGTTFWF
jgi:hypothetical protein